MRGRKEYTFSMRFKQSMLSAKSISCHSIFSAMYSYNKTNKQPQQTATTKQKIKIKKEEENHTCCSNLKIYWLKKYCNFSLQKFMHSCSKLFDLKFSNPKISKIPIATRQAGGSINSLIDLTSQENSCPYLF